jgi:hypothetical protein
VALHVATDFNEYETIVNKVDEFVLVDDGLRKRSDGDARVLFLAHRSDEVEILQIDCCEPCDGSRDDDVEGYFDCGDVRRGRDGLVSVVDEITGGVWSLQNAHSWPACQQEVGHGAGSAWSQ